MGQSVSGKGEEIPLLPPAGMIGFFDNFGQIHCVFCPKIAFPCKITGNRKNLQFRSDLLLTPLFKPF
ncbi:MAG: hypothetical protein CMJ96_01025 [Planctomycetes bacterium]|nr:hypothetical protein [Planctomycetota bacterium]